MFNLLVFFWSDFFCVLIVDAQYYVALDHIQWGAHRSPLDKGYDRRIDLYLTTYITHKRETSLLQAGFETEIAVSERPQMNALDCAVIGIGRLVLLLSHL